MTHFKKYLIGILGAGLACTACFDPKDFDFDQFSLENVNPTLHLPLLTDTIAVDAIGDDIQFINGQAYFAFDIDAIEMPSVTDVFEIGAQSIAMASPSGMTLPTGNIPSGQFPLDDDDYLSYSFNLDLTASTTTIYPDSLVFSTLQLVMANQPGKFSSGQVKIELNIPNLISEDGIPFTTTIDLASTEAINLNGYSMKIDHPEENENQITLNYQFHFNNYTYDGAQIEFDMELNSLNIEKAFGYFGQYTKIFTESVTTGSFDKIDADWNLKEAFLILNIENQLALPMRIAIDKITSYPADAGSPITVSKVDSIDILSPSAAQLGTAVSTKDTLGGTKLGDIISILPQKLDLDLRVVTNPQGRIAQNALSTVLSTPIKASARVLVPLKLKNTSLTIRDTISFNMNEIEITNMGIKLNVANGFPANIKLQCELLEKGTGTNLGGIFATPLTIPAAALKDVPGTTDEQQVATATVYDELVEVTATAENNLKNADRIIVACTIDTGNNTKFVCITEDNHIRVKLGARADVPVEEITGNF